MDSSGYKLAAVFGAIFGFSALLMGALALVASSQGGDAEETPPPQAIEVELGDFFLRPSVASVAAGSDLTFNVSNPGAIAHDLTIEGGPATALINPGETATLHFGEVTGRLTLFCSVPGHREAGMEATLTADGASAGNGHDGVSHSMTQEEMDASYLEGIEAFPAATEGLGNQPLAPQVVDGVKVFELTADEIEWEVEPGVVKQGMAYNGMIPGPVIRVALGDRIRIVLHNELEESTAMHFHGLLVPNDQDGLPGITQPLILPGETYTYEFTLRNTGSHMYHSHMHAEVQVPAGLLGALVVDGPGEPQVTQDQVMVLNDGPLGYTINGKGFPATTPLVAQQGETIRIRYMNEGLQIHPMHLHGMVQTVIALDGNPVPQPYVQDTVLVAPGQRVDVLVTASEVGTWAFHCHVLNHAEREEGMFGMVTVLVVR